MLAMLCILGLLQAGEDWKAALGREDYAAAWQAAGALTNPVARARASAEIRYRAGDPAGALAAAEEGLQNAPSELELLFYASGSALWLEDVERAREHAARLQRALDASDLVADVRQAWQRTAADHAERVRGLEEKESARTRAVRVARAVSLCGLAGAFVGLLVVSRFQGRSSKPVS